MEYLVDIGFTTPESGDFYDELPLWSAPFGLMILQRVPMRRGITILDVGAGTGFLTLELAQRCGPSSTVIAVDPWSSAMARLRRKVEHLGLSNVVLHEVDAAALSLPAGSIDVFVSNLGVNNFEHPDDVLRNCHRMAKPGARFLMTSNLIGHMAEFYQVYREVLLGMDRQDWLSKLEDHVKHRASVASMSKLLDGAGFEVVDTFTDSFAWRFADGSAMLRHQFIRLGFVGGWRAIVDEAAQSSVFAALEQALNAYAQTRGELSLTIPMACIEARRRA